VDQTIASSATASDHSRLSLVFAK